MKSMYTLIVISVLIFALGVGLTLSLHRDVDLLISYARDIKAAAENEDDEGTTQAIERFSAMWNSREHLWEFYCNHNDLNDVSLSFIHIAHSHAHGEYELIQLECSLLLVALQNIHEKELPRIENII